MRNVIILFFIISGVTVSGCCRNKGQIEIKPLHPYSSPNYEDSIDKAKYSVIKFYFIKGACVATDDLSGLVDSFLIKSVSNDSIDFLSYGYCSIYFYRESNRINENYRERPDGMISYDILSRDDDELLFIYEWRHGSFKECSFHRNGKKIRTETSKEGSVFSNNLN